MRFLPQFLDTQSAQILKSNYSKEQFLGSQVSNCFIFPMTYFNLLFSYLDNSVVLIDLWTWKNADDITYSRIHWKRIWKKG